MANFESFMMYRSFQRAEISQILNFNKILSACFYYVYL